MEQRKIVFCIFIIFFNLFLISETMVSKEEMLKMLEKTTKEQQRSSSGGSGSGGGKKVGLPTLLALIQSISAPKKTISAADLDKMLTSTAPETVQAPKKKISAADLGRMLKSFSMSKSSGSGSSSSGDKDVDNIILKGIRRRILNFNAPKAEGDDRCPCGKDTLANMDDVVLTDNGNSHYKKTREEFDSGTQGKIFHGYSVKDGKCIIIKELSLVDITDYTRQNCDMEYVASGVVKNCYEKDALAMMRIVRIFDVARTAEKISIFMEMGKISAESYWDKILENTTLNSITPLERQYAMKIELATELVVKIVKAFVALHSVGIIHLDFKLANAMLFLDEKDLNNYVLKLIDLGAARTTSSHKTVDEINAAVMNRFAVLTYEHCAPEQTTIKQQGETYYIEPTSKSDIWGIGSVIIFMLTGEYTNVWFHENQGENTVGMTRMAIWLRRNAQINSQNGALFQMALACLHVKSNQRPMAYQMLAYMSNWCTMPVASIYMTMLGISSRTFSGVTDKENIGSCYKMSPEEYTERGRRANLERRKGRNTTT